MLQHYPVALSAEWFYHTFFISGDVKSWKLNNWHMRCSGGHIFRFTNAMSSFPWSSLPDNYLIPYSVIHYSTKSCGWCGKYANGKAWRYKFHWDRPYALMALCCVLDKSILQMPLCCARLVFHFGITVSLFSHAYLLYIEVKKQSASNMNQLHRHSGFSTAQRWQTQTDAWIHFCLFVDLLQV